MMLCEKCGRVIQSYEVKYRLELGGRRVNLCNEDAKEAMKALEAASPKPAPKAAATAAATPAAAAAPAAPKPAPPKLTPEELEARKKAALEKAAAMKAAKEGAPPA